MADGPAAPTQVALMSSDAAVLSFDGAASKVLKGSAFPLRAAATAAEGRAEVTAQLTLYYCPAASESLCYFKAVRLAAPIEVAPGEPRAKIDLAYRLAPQSQ